MGRKQKVTVRDPVSEEAEARNTRLPDAWELVAVAWSPSLLVDPCPICELRRWG